MATVTGLRRGSSANAGEALGPAGVATVIMTSGVRVEAAHHSVRSGARKVAADTGLAGWENGFDIRSGDPSRAGLGVRGKAAAGLSVVRDRHAAKKLFHARAANRPSWAATVNNRASC